MSPRAHVLFLIDHLVARGGGEGNLLKAVQLLSAQGMRCSVATFSISADIQKSLNVPVYLFSWRRVYHLDSLRAAFQLRRLIHRERVDIVQTYFETSNLWGGLIAKLSGASVVSCRRDLGILRSRKHKWGYILINRISDRVLAVSEEVRRFCINQDHVDPRKIVVLYNGVDLNHVASSDASADLLARNNARHVVACVANIREIKGIDILVRTAHIVCRKMPDVLFVVAGNLNDGPYAESLQKLIASLGVEDNFKLLGFAKDPVPLLKHSQAFCLLSRSEGFSNAVLEAMACGLPPVVTRVGGNAEAIVDGENGFLVPVEDPAAAAERLLALLRNPQRAREMGEAARETVRLQFSADAMIRNLMGLYDELMAERKRLKPT